jgi:carboxypeptidase C (cathepsin A)
MPGAAFNLFIGGESFGTVYAPENTAAALQRFASQSQARSLGRKPGWYK